MSIVVLPADLLTYVRDEMVLHPGYERAASDVTFLLNTETSTNFRSLCPQIPSSDSISAHPLEHLLVPEVIFFVVGSPSVSR
jgi:hypothetical protein